MNTDSLFIRYMKFLGSSIVGTIVDMVALWLLSDFLLTGYWGEYLFSPLISFQISVCANYLISYYYVWGDRVRNRRGRRSFMRLYLLYNLSSSSVFVLRIFLLLIVERLTGWDVLLCNLLATCVSGILNFIIGNQVIFRKKAV